MPEKLTRYSINEKLIDIQVLLCQCVSMIYDTDNTLTKNQKVRVYCQVNQAQQAITKASGELYIED